MNIAKLISKPEYLYSPRHVWHRLTRPRTGIPARAEVILPWGASLMAQTNENIGRGLYFEGVFDKVVPEAIARLLDKRECGVEIGANIGQNCSLMAVKTGPEGQVLAFEPHPEIFSELEANCKKWQRLKLSPIRLEKVALSDEEGEAILANGPEFQTNRGTAALAEGPNDAQGFKVKVKKLDGFLKHIPKVGVCKIDVEGNELKVLQGAMGTLRRKGIRDIIFEDYQRQPSAVSSLLQSEGYAIFRLHASWLKPRLVPLLEKQHATGQFTFNFLATLEPIRARARFRWPGWFCLLNL